ncbi:hypothetical protein [Hyphomicrobium zavarzinii]|uniref:hypothetical protein n=1 Tax=Hyphomicrobium zavarzinii TaxID=48292 RepID=UPI0012EBC357|nr:hypothetical protein [Hyphomicrobium zavarzinii]
MNKTILASSVLLLLVTTPLVSAFAHDDYDRHTRNHRKHYQFHSGVGETHARAHEDGFSSRREHRAYHRALKDLHGEFHEDHPNTRHDHYPSSSRYR